MYRFITLQSEVRTSCFIGRMNLLKPYRKKSNLTQDDIAFILKKQKASISRYEKGQRIAPLSLIILYKVIFNVSLERLFRDRYRSLILQLLERSKELITILKNDSHAFRAQDRIAFLQDIVDRIGCLEDVNNDKNRRK